MLVVVIATPTAAQTTPETTPDKGVIGYGIDAGVLFPYGTFENTLAIEGHGEYYVTPRLAIRGLLGFANPGVTARTQDRLREVKLLASGVYNWTHNDWRPFVAGGVGAYFVRLLRDGQPDPSGETRGGLNFGGGAEYIRSEQDAIKAEMRWDIVSAPPGLPDASGLTISVGYKRYF
jgi:hypothetical protein